MSPPPTTSTRRARTLLLGGGAALAAGAALVFSNPTPAEFELYAGERLVDLTTREICGDDGLPMLLGLLVQNCPELVHGQRKLLGSLAAANTRRFNAGLFSLYNTDVGGQEVLPWLHLPRYHVTTLAGAGQFLQLEAISRPVERK
ncbi:DUF4359 domain-containing protein [Cyanobium sp. ATX 6F1]|uniref:DUF4359 domain-containing protein n=1 Tax=Cyanobium sp. ATX 6F1 TaxID=2823702 RepID=UPI0020CD6447|nr:DUF4359 domain-containing protein [Cyanobium sp. ATX 6F1]